MERVGKAGGFLREMHQLVKAMVDHHQGSCANTEQEGSKGKGVIRGFRTEQSSHTELLNLAAILRKQFENLFCSRIVKYGRPMEFSVVL
jgi:hypothetical protein